MPEQNNSSISKYEKRILIVEDDAMLRELYEELLKSEGYEVDAAQDGEQGIIAIDKGGYDLIILDVILPGKDGLTILKEIKKHTPLEKNGPIIVLSNLGQDEIIKECFENGASGFLIKSALAPDQILQEVKRFTSESPIQEPVIPK